MAPRTRLLQALGLTFGLAVAVGNMIGAGILRTPGAVASELPAVWPFLSVWIAGGLYAFLGANAFAELGTMMPRSGGQYVFVRRALGDYAGLVAGWSDWIATCGATAAVAIVIGEYGVVLFPELRAVEVVALAVIAALTLLQWFGVRSGGWTQIISTVAKVLALLGFAGACVWLGARNPAASSVVAEHEGSMLLGFLVALQAVVWAYDGWAAPAYFAEEVREPERNLPRALFGGAAIVIALYLIMNAGLLAVVPLGSLEGQKLAAGIVARHLFGPYGDTVLRSMVVVILLSAVNARVLMAPRVLFAMGRDGLWWGGATEVNAGGTPDVALLFSSLLAAVFIASGRFEQVIAVVVFFVVANYALSFMALFVLRRREPDIPRPFRAWGHPWTTALALLASLAFLAVAVVREPRNALWAVVALAATLPLYALVRRTTIARVRRSNDG